MTDAPERIWARYIRTQEGRWIGQHAAQEVPWSSASEYVRADLYDGLLQKVEIATKALEGLSYGDGDAFFYFLLRAWSNGDLVSRDLIDQINEENK